VSPSEETSVVRLRAHRDADVEGLVALAQRAWVDVEASIDAVLGSPLDRLATPSWAAHHEAVVRAACASADTTVVVAEDDQGELLGFVAHVVHPPSDAMSAYGEIVVIGVDPRTRNQGLGSTLLDRAVADLRDRGVPVIMVETGGDEGHTPARALYESAGFTRLPVAQYWLPGSPATVTRPGAPS
jgi:ribosomal protein S18 acetylase RimI-like enzyme